MAYVVRKPGARWEVRESRTTPKGPRSRTLASFRTLSPEVIEHAVKRSRGVLSATEIRRLAERAGAPLEEAPGEEAAATLLAEIDRGRFPSPARCRMLAAALGETGEPSEAERAVAPWLAATPKERGEALYDLLLLTDSLPVRKRPATLRFPHFESRAA